MWSWIEIFSVVTKVSAVEC